MTTNKQNEMAVAKKISEWITYVAGNLEKINYDLIEKGMSENINDRLNKCKAQLDLAVDLSHITVVNMTMKELKGENQK